MTVFTGNGYLIADLATLRAIPAADRPAFKVALLVAGLGWYEYDNAATTGGIVPNDSPVNGRWFPISKELLRANRTYFVRTDGNDSNTGLTNTSGGAFLTIQKAIDVISTIDPNGFAVTIQLADGTYSGVVNLRSVPNNGLITIQGNTSNAASVIITASDTNGTIQAFNTAGTYFLRWLTIQSTGNRGIYNSNSIIAYERVVFGSMGGSAIHIVNADGGITGNSLNGVYYPYTIGSSAAHHIYNTGAGSIFTCASATITVSGSPAFSGAFCQNENLGYCNFFSPVFSGSATGSRYSATSNSVINTFGGGATFLPGNSAGSTATGGLYL